MDKKILFAHNYAYLRGGSEKVCFDEMKILEAHGVFVDSISVNDATSIRMNGAVANNISEPTTVDRLANLFWNRKSRAMLDRILNGKVDYDILHAHNIYGRLSHSLVSVAKKHGLKVVVTLHDMKYVCPHYTALNNNNLCSDCSGGRFYKASINKCHKDSYVASTLISFELYFLYYSGLLSLVDEFISPSKFLIDYYKKSGFPFNINYIPNFLPDMEKPNLKNEEIDKGYYLYVGRLSYEKGVMTLLKAFKKNRRKLIIIGDGPLLNEIKNYIKDSQLGNTVTLTGYLNTEGVHSYIESCSALIVPSEWYENAPITILEALSYGKKILASNIGGIPEMVHENKNGFLFSPSNCNSINEAIEKFELLSSNDQMRMKDYSLSLSNTIFSEKEHYKKIMNLYKKYD
jgi:glycosyltransferase involved in cell wall biosynthesis